MKIGVDFGGVCELDPYGWKGAIQNLKVAGHEVFLVSHAHDERDAKKRADFAASAGMADRTFWDTLDEATVRERKAQIVRELGIGLFVEDDMARLVEIAKTGCACVYVPQSRVRLGVVLLREFSHGGYVE